MTCQDMNAVITSRSSDSALPPAAAEHIAGCESCRDLMLVLDNGPEIPAAPVGHVKLIQASLLRDLRPVRPLAPVGVFLAGFTISFLLVVIMGSIQLHAYGWSV